MPVERGRFGHLIYTSFDDGSGTGGGWQVKDVSGGIDSAEREILTSWVATRFDLMPALDRYPTPTDIDNRQRRLMYAKVSCGAAYWHTVEAGTDGSGRPGNVFAHVVLDREIDSAEPPFRPIELWMSPTWLMPYGPVNTRVATVDSVELPALGGVVTRDRVIDFLLDASVFRLGTFQVLLDAVAYSWDGGPPVVLLVEDSASAVLWIGAVEYFMSPGTSRNFSWSTHDRADAISESIRRKIHLTIAPSSESDSLTGRGDIVLLDDTDDPTLGVLDEDPHLTRAGTAVAVTPWSMLAQAVLIDHSTAILALGSQDSIAIEAGDTALSPMWPLAMAVASMPGMDDVKKEVARVISEQRPAELAPGSRLAMFSDQVDEESAPKTTAEAVAALRRAQSRSLSVSTPLSYVVRLAIADSDWLIAHRAGEIGAEFTGPAPAALAAAIGTVLHGYIDAAQDKFTKKIDQAVRILRIADLLVMTNCDKAMGVDVIDLLCNAFETVVAEFSDTASAIKIIEKAGGLDERTLHLVVRPMLATSPVAQKHSFGHRFEESVLRWAFSKYPNIPILREIADGTDKSELRHDVSLFSEIVYGTLIDDWIPDPRQSNLKEFADLALWGIFNDVSETGAQHRLDEVRMLCRLNTLSFADLDVLFTRFGTAVPPEAAHAAVVTEKVSPHLASVLAQLTAAGHRMVTDPDVLTSQDRATVSWAALRGVGAWTDLRPDELNELVDKHFDVIVADLGGEKTRKPTAPVEMAPDVLRNLAILFYIAQSRGRDVSAVPAVDRDKLQTALGIQSRVLSGLIEAGVVDVAGIAARSFFDYSRQQSNRVEPRRSHEDDVIADLARRRLYTGPLDWESLRDAMWPIIRELSAAEAENIFASYGRYVEEWVARFELRTRPDMSWPAFRIEQQ
ncbi:MULTISPECIES: hypothetical protein [unclassified Rhodococcus (in: high G+C Gram-positive bacteria)]|uniref:GAP1-N2 domain-containing protein n=1 Tax=unclassified Rhodococcus (in: high G+C Gram-positive bacteria) TaxID=192944 RepID=UPI000B9BED2B|nr:MULTISPECIES: hypothetical protein [unclassified Rhodococcus (in: high G+C Gram-positive bacteria)]OZE36133.1 hypothetical protein CH259_13615 [Rhodococcus sp. 05-2254-4]OZE41228.1 hypothetical protein CH261_25000 [Rhodococcus sp. 05-2254-3]OZE44575.1 hypothetical protein CH283_27255 [Rhodococcus sp. 05-2254-2]